MYLGAAATRRSNRPSWQLRLRRRRTPLPKNIAAPCALNPQRTSGSMDYPDYRNRSNDDWNSDSDDFVTASELREFVFCERAWWLKRQGYELSHKAQAERAERLAFHEQRARAARTGE